MVRPVLTCTLLLALLAAGGPAQDEGGAAAPGPRRPDVLLIAVDDLNDWVGHLRGIASTPHVDRLAARGTAFANAHCASPVCNPARTALLGGRRPTATTEKTPRWREALGGLPTLPEHFAAHGYVVAGAGKVFHTGNEKAFPEYFAATERDPRPPGRRNARFVPLKRVRSMEREDAFDWTGLEQDDEWMEDHQVASWMAERLQRDDEQPLFAAVGFKKPHLPWYVPAPWFDEHPPESIRVPEVPEDELNDVPQTARQLVQHELTAELRERGLEKEAVRAYLAAVSFVDAQVGRLLDALDRSPRAERTIVVLVSDHGFHLGEKGHWRKFSLWEPATRIPLVIVRPGESGPGRRTARAVDALSVYPTLCELAGLEIPAHVEGVSVAPLLEDPQADWPHAALTSFKEHRALRTDRWRLILYKDGKGELYDHESDPDEHRNLIGLYTHRDVEAELRVQLAELTEER